VLLILKESFYVCKLVRAYVFASAKKSERRRRKSFFLLLLAFIRHTSKLVVIRRSGREAVKREIKQNDNTFLSLCFLNEISAAALFVASFSNDYFLCTAVDCEESYHCR
jgi:hypothetical protein